MGRYEKFTPVIQLDEITSTEERILEQLASISYNTGDILYFDGSDIVNLAVGSENQMLVVSGGIPSWQDVAIHAATVTNATLTTSLTVNGGTLTLTADVANDSVLTIGSGAVSVSGTNTGDQDLSGYVTKATYDAHTILYATSDNTPAALTVTEQTLVGRLTGGNISAVAIGIANGNIVQINAADVASGEFAKFTAAGLESRSTAEVLSDIGAQSSLTFGIANTNAVQIDAADVADDEYARFTANGLESRSAAEVASDIGAATASSKLSFFASTTSAELAGVISDETGSGALVFGTEPSFTNHIVVSGAAETARSIFLKTSGSTRWQVLTSATAESGSNAGSDFALNSYDDSGDYFGTPLVITRSSGIVNFYADITITGTNGTLTLNSETDGGDFNLYSNANGTLAIYGSAGNTLNLQLLDGNFLMSSGSKISWDSDDVTLTHSANKLAFEGGEYEFSDGNVTILTDTVDTAGTYEFIFLKKRLSDPYTVQSGDYFGIITFKGYDSNGYSVGARIAAYVDGTPGDGDMPGRLEFLTTADGSNSPTTRMTIKNDGAILMPAVYSDTITSNVRDLQIDDSGQLGYVSSSIRYKENISDLVGSERLYDLRPVDFTYKKDGTKSWGLIAEEAEEVMPEIVSYNEDGLVETVEYSRLIAPMLAEIQNLKKEVERLKAKK